MRSEDISMVSCQKGPTRHVYAWQVGPFWQDTLDIWVLDVHNVIADLFYDATIVGAPMCLAAVMEYLAPLCLTYWGRNKMVAISQTTCSWEAKQQFPSIGSDYGLAAARPQAIIWTNDG